MQGPEPRENEDRSTPKESLLEYFLTRELQCSSEIKLVEADFIQQTTVTTADSDIASIHAIELDQSGVESDEIYLNARTWADESFIAFDKILSEIYVPQHEINVSYSNIPGSSATIYAQYAEIESASPKSDASAQLTLDCEEGGGFTDAAIRLTPALKQDSSMNPSHQNESQMSFVHRAVKLHKTKIVKGAKHCKQSKMAATTTFRSFEKWIDDCLELSGETKIMNNSVDSCESKSKFDTKVDLQHKKTRRKERLISFTQGTSSRVYYQKLYASPTEDGRLIRRVPCLDKNGAIYLPKRTSSPANIKRNREAETVGIRTLSMPIEYPIQRLSLNEKHAADLSAHVMRYRSIKPNSKMALKSDLTVLNVLTGYHSLTDEMRLREKRDTIKCEVDSPRAALPRSNSPPLDIPPTSPGLFSRVHNSAWRLAKWEIWTPVKEVISALAEKRETVEADYFLIPSVLL